MTAIAAEVSMSQYHFSRLFKQSMGTSVHQYMLQCWVECAKQLLLQRNHSETEVANGFVSVALPLDDGIEYSVKLLTPDSSKLERVR